MEFTFNHFNFNVLDLDKSIAFYRDVLGLHETRRKQAPDGSFILVFMGDNETGFTLELTWHKDRKEAYDLGENEFHLAFWSDDIVKARAEHERMGLIYKLHENPAMSIYYIKDPDGYCIEILPAGTGVVKK